jgi:N-succinyldiaminopimelate aminotransferase
VRFAFCKKDEVLLEASRRLAAAGTPTQSSERPTPHE